MAELPTSPAPSLDSVTELSACHSTGAPTPQPRSPSEASGRDKRHFQVPPSQRGMDIPLSLSPHMTATRTRWSQTNLSLADRASRECGPGILSEIQTLGPHPGPRPPHSACPVSLPGSPPQASSGWHRYESSPRGSHLHRTHHPP